MPLLFGWMALRSMGDPDGHHERAARSDALAKWKI
jgi:hypothetical protein